MAVEGKISAVINTYNAEEHLEQVLESLKNFDEIVVCDMESTDSTLAIAARYGCKIVTFPKKNFNICEPARDFAIHSASNPWVLVVDADEIVPDGLREFLYKGIRSGFEDAYLVPRINRLLGAEVTGTLDYQLRFFRHDKAYWPPVIHARPEIDGEIHKIPPHRELSLIHLDDPTLASRFHKFNVYSDYEVGKRKGKSYGAVKMLFRPVWFFIKSYLFGGGIKDGKRGIVSSYMAAVYQVMLLSKLYEEKISKKKP